MTEPVSILFTMDVEPPTSGDGLSSGPSDPASGVRRVREYIEVLGEFGYVPTLFIHPELGREWAGFYLDLQQRGVCLGLHLHTVKFREVANAVELGGLSRERQLETLDAAARMFETYFGFWPKLFRPGCFSANDATCGVLEELGFEGGSISIPGRIWPERFCVWSGACPHPHHTHACFRQVSGAMRFVDIPLSVDRIGGLLRHPLGFMHYADLRPGGVYSEEEDSGRDHGVMVGHIVRQLAEEQPLLRTVVVDVHNDRTFKDPRAVSTRQLRLTLERLTPLLAAAGMHPVADDFSGAISRFRRLASAQ